MTTYAEADLPRLLPGSSDDAAGARAIFADARAAAPLASGLFGPIVIHHRDVVDLLRDGQRVFVHCQAGRSRSVAVVAMALMKHQGLTRPAAVNAIRAKREIALTPSTEEMFRASV